MIAIMQPDSWLLYSEPRAFSIKRPVMYKLVALMLSLLLGDVACSEDMLDRGSVRSEGPVTTDKETILNMKERGKILLEIFLATDRKGDVKAIRSRFAVFGIHKVRFQFLPLGSPPENIAIGGDVPAEAARLAIEMALRYNKGIRMLIPEERLTRHYIAFGSSSFDESFQVAISSDDLKRLQDTTLNTEQFHRLYRTLAPLVRRRGT